MKIMPLLFFLITSLHGVTSIANAFDEDFASPPSHVCHKITISSIPLEYCHRHQEYVNSPDLIYFFHAHGGDARSWFRQLPGTYIVQKILDYKGYRPQIISISLGEEWALTKEAMLTSVFKDTIMPTVENLVMKNRTVRKRHIIAQSMGAFTATTLVLMEPEKYSRVALICPALTTLNPHAEPADIARHKNRFNMKDRKLQKLLTLSLKIFPNYQSWHYENIFNVLLQAKNTDHLKFYLSIGRNDGYGFLEGAERFYRLSNQKGMRSLISKVPGGHCNFSRRGTAKFILGEL